MGGKPEPAKSGDRRSVRLDDRSYSRLKMLATMQDCDLAEAIDFLFDQVPKIRKTVDEAVANGRKIIGKEE